MKVDEKELRELLAEYGNASDGLEVGPLTARKAMSALADTPWAKALNRADGGRMLWTGVTAVAIVRLLEAVQDDLAYGTQVETGIAGKLQPVIDALRDYYGDELDEGSQ